MTISSSEKILIVESDPAIGEQIARQTLAPFGFQVHLAADGPGGLRMAAGLQPDVLIADLNLPGLSGKDLLVALSSQGMTIPTIIMAEKGHEANVIQAFRLGASDYLMLPFREEEILACVERALELRRDIRARESLQAQLKLSNAGLELRLRELNSITTAWRDLLPSITDMRSLAEKIVKAVANISGADMSWLTLKDDRTKSFVLASYHNPPASLSQKIGQPLDDNLGPLVAGSGKTLLLQNPELENFRISNLGTSAMVLPLQGKKDAIGILTVMRKSGEPFGESERNQAEAVAAYASTLLANARLFRALAQSAETARLGEKHNAEQIQHLRQAVQAGVDPALSPLEMLLNGALGQLTHGQILALEASKTALNGLTLLNGQPDDQPKS
ncbi:MAG TPA: response regulator [Anaerolineales bacterium]|jgi:FixJ family two-component response regulator